MSWTPLLIVVYSLYLSVLLVFYFEVSWSVWLGPSLQISFLSPISANYSVLSPSIVLFSMLVGKGCYLEKTYISFL